MTSARRWHMICIELFYMQADITKAQRHTPGVQQHDR